MSKSASILKRRDAICSLALTDRQRVDCLIEKYGDRFYPDVCKHFPTRNRERLYPTLEKAIRSNAPSLQEVDRVWSDDGQTLSVVWLKIQLTEVFSFVGLREKMSESQKTALAQTLRSMCVDMNMHVTMAELMVFFTRFRQGRYQRFMGYEHANPQVVTASFSDFLDELYRRRIEVHQQMKNEREVREREDWARTAVPMPESSKRLYEQLMGKMRTDLDKAKAEAKAADFELPQEVKDMTLREIEEAKAARKGINILLHHEETGKEER